MTLLATRSVRAALVVLLVALVAYAVSATALSTDVALDAGRAILKGRAIL